MPQITWSTTRTALNSALGASSLPASAAARAVGSAVLAELDALGAAYDARWAVDGATLTAREATYTSLLSTWTSQLASLWADASGVVAYAEHKTYLGRVGLVPEPRALKTALGEMALTEHTDALPSPWADPSPPVVAALTLNGSGAVPVLRVEARDEGIAGNSVRVTVADASSARATECKITVTRGSATPAYAEVYDNLDLSTADARAPDAGESLLVRSFTLVGIGRPVNLSATALAGGAGNVRDAVTARIERLVTAARSGETVLTETDRRTLEALLDQVTTAWTTLPELVNPLAQVEAELEASLARATAQTALLAALYP